jgi:hypothetical protein
MFKVKVVAWHVHRENSEGVVEHRVGVFGARGLAVAVLSVTFDADETGRVTSGRHPDTEVSQQTFDEVDDSRAWLEDQRRAHVLQGWTEVPFEPESFP